MSRRQKDLFPNLPDGKKYVSDIPELVAEWHPTKNEGKQPEDFSFGSNTKVWWKCSNGHEWKTAIYHRTRGTGCPVCYNERRPETVRPKTSPDFNLLTENPSLCVQWDYKQNKYPPSHYLPNSGASVFWKCPMGVDHVWKARIASRSALNDEVLNGCPFCAGRKPSTAYNLAVIYPELLEEWDYNKNKRPPEGFTPQSNQLVWWKCIKGHEWEATIDSRNSSQRPSSCPYCSPTRKMASEANNMATTRPDIARYFHPTKNGSETPEMLVEGTGKLLWWQCELGHEWQQRGYAMLKTKGHPCPTCRKTK